MRAVWCVASVGGVALAMLAGAAYGQIACDDEGYSIESGQQDLFTASDMRKLTDAIMEFGPVRGPSTGKSVKDALPTARMDVQRTLDPIDVTGLVRVGDEFQDPGQLRADASSCVTANTRFLEASRTRGRSKNLSGDYVCALLRFEHECLTKVEAPPMVDLAIAKAAVVALHDGAGRACMGIVGADAVLTTSRHCFVSPMTGKPYSGPAIRDGQTLDGARRIRIADTAIAGLVLASPFELDRDAVRLPVTLHELKQGSAPLPTLVHAPVGDIETAAWLAGNVEDLLAAEELQSAAPKKRPWAEGVRWSRWLGAQCRVHAVDGTCIYHSCQTTPGFSGSPIVLAARSEAGVPTVRFAGVHSGASGALPDGWGYCSEHGDPVKAQAYKAFNVGDLEIQ